MPNQEIRDLRSELQRFKFLFQRHQHTGSDYSSVLNNATINVRRMAQGGADITVYPGDNIQAALDEVKKIGGGRVLFTPGTYNINNHLVVYSGTRLVGHGLNTIINFGGGAYSIRMVGTDAYSDGTVSISHGSTTVTGSSTAFTSAMVGTHILLEDLLYEVTAVTDGTHLTIASEYFGTSLSGATYFLADTVHDITIRSLLISNSSAPIIKAQYFQNIYVDDCVMAGGSIGIDADDASFITIINSAMVQCTQGVTLNGVHFGMWLSCTIAGTTNQGFVLNTARNHQFAVFNIQGTNGDGAEFTSCKNNSWVGFSVKDVAGIGMEFISGNSDMDFTNGTISYCTGDGIKLTATTDYLQFASNSINNNGGYGMNIAASTCDNNVIGVNSFHDNSSGNLNDSGTGTVIGVNGGV
jgi:hypothetical protein